MEFGPFTYQEYQTFDDLEYTKVKQSEVSGSFSESVDTEMDAVWATFSQTTEFKSDPTGYVDTPMYLPN